MNEKQVKKMIADDFDVIIKERLDSAIIFKYISNLEKENNNLKDQLEQSIAVADTNSELADSYYNEIKKLKEQYCERTDCSGRIGNSKKVEEVQQENKQLRGILQTHEILLRANVEENQRLKGKQKEFIEWLNCEIKVCKESEEKYADGDDYSYYNENELRKEILSKYKEITGSDKQ